MMPLYRCFLFCLVPATWTICARAQPQSATADTEFRALQALAIPRESGTGARSAAELDVERRQQFATFVLAADNAKVFYERYPEHQKVAEARKIEIDSLLKAVRAGATEHEPRALRLARGFRADQAISSRDRFQIAMMVREVAIRRQNLGEAKDEILAQYEKAALDLYGEFPDEPGVYDLLLGVARNGSAAKTRALAGQLLLMPSPPAIKEQARSLVARLDMVGKPLVAEWEDAEGRSHRIQDYRGSVVVFYVWASWAPSPEAHQRVKASVPGGAMLVSVNLDPDAASGLAAKAKAGIGGIAYTDNRGVDAPLVRQLRADKVPGVYVVDRVGRFVGGGAPDELPALLALATNP